MKLKELKEMKAGLKSTVASSKIKVVRKKGSGGARPGSGRDPLPFEVKKIYIDAPALFSEIMKVKGITNKTGYINNLIARDIINNADLKPAQLKKVQKIKNDTEKYNTWEKN